MRPDQVRRDANAQRRGVQPLQESLPAFHGREEDLRAPARAPHAPSISLPKGGGAIRGIGEKFAADPVSGTGRLTVPLAASPGRFGFGPELALSYDSGAGNGPFGVGWHLSLPTVTRKTELGLPQYRDAEGSDVFVLSEAEDLVPVVDAQGHPVVDETSVPEFAIQPYHPRIESDFGCIERWTRKADGDVHWRSLSPDNVLAVYGRDGSSRICDPADDRRVFSWLLCETRDDRGNAILYSYRQEDALGVDVTQPHEFGRGGADSPVRRANRYIKRIRYGNRVPLLDAAGRRPIDVSAQAIEDARWLFEVVFDYGEHSAAEPKSGDTGAWLCRNDPFSTYRAGFEIRTYRLCQRVLMFHHFPLEADIGQDCLVRSTEFAYRETRGIPTDRQRGNPAGSFIANVEQSGYVRATGGGYTRKSLPPLAFEYSEADISLEVQTLDPGSAENLPVGLDGASYLWIDLNGEGLAGVLTEQSNAWFYKPNLGGGRLGPLQRVASRPSLSNLGGSPQQLLDLAGDGHLDLVQLASEPAGFFEHTEDDDWERFMPFSSLPRLDWASPNVQLVDLTGDGFADVLVTDDDVLSWHASLAEEGFGPAQQVAHAVDEEHGPRLVLADGTETIFLADMSGDGLMDLVRIRSSEVCYWPNLGYGRFGAKVTMSNAPRLDRPDQFDPRRVRLADVDGSGVIDLFYIGRREIRLWFNESGNGWSAPHRLPDFSHLDNFSSVQVADLLGNGTACVVWSSPLPADAGRPLQYIDLMGGTKPHLLVGFVNNLGAETRIRYAASTSFYLADQMAGKPWITRLPFPVHVVEHVEQVDRISRTRFASRYRYHHGYFDGVEREFRGFAMVEQEDTEAFEDYILGVARVEGTQELAPELYQPPVTTRTWFHTGAYVGADRILHQLRDEYYLGQQHVPEPSLPVDMDEQEFRECVRALKGLALRQEVYSFDGSPEADEPYSVTESNYDVRRVQRRGEQPNAVFFPYGCETLTFVYERNPSDPRVAQSFNLEVGPYGNVVKSASVVYGRATVDPALPAEVIAAQRKLRIVYGEADYAPDLDRRNPVPTYRLRAPHEIRDYEVTGVAPAAERFELGELRSAIAGTAAIPYEAIANETDGQRRLLSHVRTLFRGDDLAVLPLGQWDSLGLTFESYRLAFTPGVVATHYAGVVTDADFTDAGYVHFDGDANWWIPSGTAVYPTDPAAHFYLAVGGRDGLGLESVATFDQYDLLPEALRATQAEWTEVSAVNDYRLLAPRIVTDPNENRLAVEFDPLGLIVKSAVMGKAGVAEGDTLADPTARIEYDLFNWMLNGKPNFSHVFAREEHGAANPRWQESFLHYNGGGEVAMIKAQAHPGKALQANPDGTTTEVDANPRWVGNGRTILNNKGNPVKSYEPFFSVTHEYESEEVLRTVGATAVRFYDAAGRNIRTDFPNGTFSRTTFDAWTQRLHDANDTVLESTWYSDRGSPDPADSARAVERPRTARGLAGRKARRDAGGRSLRQPWARGSQHRRLRRRQDGVDANRQRPHRAPRSHVRRAGTRGRKRVHRHGPRPRPRAERRARSSLDLSNVLGLLVRTWDEHGRTFRAEYDALHRPISTFAEEPGRPEKLFNYVVYGDRHPDAVQRNLRGAAHQIFDPAGMVRVQTIDFKGNPTSVERVLALDYSALPDWGALASQPDYAAVQTAASPRLATAEPFAADTSYDALSRPTELLLPGGTVMRPAYNEANFLSSLAVQIEGQGPFIDFLRDQDYDAKGQRRFARYGNDVLTTYTYDPDTYRLTNILTAKSGAPAADSLQNFHYTYDPVGNITQLRDDAQETHFFDNAVVKPEFLYEYDALSQLVKATGREHAGLANNTSEIVESLPHPNDPGAVRNYTEHYDYDLLGNLLEVRHVAAGGAGTWTRHYHYAYQDDPADSTNRLASTSLPGDPEGGPYSVTYSYDPLGNMDRLRTPNPGELVWNLLDQLEQVDLGGGGTAHYTYSVAGQRVRKVIERQGGGRTERIYLGALEIYRERQGNNAPHLERRTLHIADDVGGIAQIDVKTRDDNGVDPANPLDTPLIRYQYGNHLGSALLETDAAGTPISYEEYHPFGTSAYRSGKPGFDLSLKRYRFSGKERDDETGLYYFGARYYAPWLGRWTSPDPAGFVDGLNLYRYCRNNPVMVADPNGCQPPAEEQRCGRLMTSDPWDVWVTFVPHPSGEGSMVVSCGPYVAPEIVVEAKVKRPRRRRKPKPKPKAEPPPPPPPPEPPAPKPSSPRTLGLESYTAPDVVTGATTQTPTPQPTPGTGAAAMSQTTAGGERFIWEYSFPGTGVAGSQRGRILEWMYGVPWRSNTAGIDVITDTAVKQLKSTSSYGTIGGTTRSATRDAANWIQDNPAQAGSRRPQAVIITPTDAPADAVRELRTALNPGPGRVIPPNSLPPEHVRGLPGRWGTVGGGLTFFGAFFSIWGLYGDIERGDVPMGVADTLGTVGGGLELYALATGGTVFGVSAVSAGLVLGGAGIAIGSGIYAYRAWQRGDTAGVVAGIVGVAAGVAIVAGIVFGAPLLLAGGLIAAAAVGIFHFFRWLFS